MKAWIVSVAALAKNWLIPRGRVVPRHRARPDLRRTRMAIEGLERREVLSGAGVIPFATLAGQVSTPGQPTQLVLHLSADQLASSRSRPILLGFYAETPAGSTINPAIAEVDGPKGQLSPLILPSRGTTPPSKTVFLTQILPVAGQAQDVKVAVTGIDGTAGNVVVQAFLPGDVNGDRTVDASDLARVNASYGSAIGQTRYDAPADFNGDGHIGCVDRRLTQLNLGASVANFPVPTPAAVPVAAAAVPKPAPVQVAPVQVATVPVVFSQLQPATVTLAPTTQATTTTVSVPATVTTAPTQTATVSYIPAAASGSSYVYGQPVVLAPTLTYAQPVVQAPTVTYAQPVVQAPTVTYAQPVVQAPTVTYGQPVVQNSTIAYGQTAPTGMAYLAQPVAAGSTVPASTSGPMYLLYPSTMPTSAPAIAQVPVTPAPIAVPTPAPAAPAPAASAPMTVTIPGTMSYQPGESGPVYYYGQSVVQAPSPSSPVRMS